ncbi:MAG: spore coat protein CotJB [Clostridia bacterium]|nr:spore coat protein CotJB [Clostridia bacterium]
MNEKAMLRRKIFEADFVLYELALFLDTHPDSKKAMELMCEYRKMRSELIKEYESRFGNYIETLSDVPESDRWKWIDGPWPWDNNFMEG